MDLIKQLIKRSFCRHKYEFRSKYLICKNGKIKCFENYKCSKCNKRKEKKIR